MGSEFAQRREWNHSASLDWDLLDNPSHTGVQQLVKDLNRLYQTTPALYEIDFDGNGFEWIDCSDKQQGVISFLRRGKNKANLVLIVCNLTPVVRHGYRIGVPAPGHYHERINSDSSAYGGSGIGNLGTVV